MTTPAITPPHLGVWSIVNDTIVIFFRRLHWVLLLTFIPFLVMIVVGFAAVGWQVLNVFGGQPPDPSGLVQILALLVQILAFAITTALLVPLAVDAKLNNRVRLGRYLAATFAQLLPLATCMVVASLAAYLALVLFMVPGFLLVFGLTASIPFASGLALVPLLVPFVWVVAVFAVLVPVVVVERGEFRALGRSVGLTKGYRWPIVGVFAIITVALLAMFLMVGVVLTGGMAFLLPMIQQISQGEFESGGLILTLVGLVLATGVANAVPMGLFSISVALIYARLKEIKDGMDLEQIRQTFG